MRRLSVAVCAAILILCAPLAAAQSASTNKKSMDGKTAMVTGCVMEGDESGHYMLTNAMTIADATTKTGTTGSSSAESMPVTYNLMGGELKMHVGHKVEVTGTMDPMMKKDSMDKSSSMDKDKTKSMSDSAKMSHDMLKVESVKMISSTCP
jgi:hypothetical protein